MLIGIDLDSVLADINIPLNRFHNERYGTNLTFEDYTDYNLSTVWHCSINQVLERLFEFYDSPFMDHIPVMPGAVDGIHYLGKNHSLALITSRPHSTETKTLLWLDRYFPDSFERTVLSNQVSTEGSIKRTKADIGNELGIQAMIDDHIEFVTDCCLHGIRSFLFEAPWNKDKKIPMGIVRISGWPDIQNYF